MSLCRLCRAVAFRADGLFTACAKRSTEALIEKGELNFTNGRATIKLQVYADQEAFDQHLPYIGWHNLTCEDRLDVRQELRTVRVALDDGTLGAEEIMVEVRDTKDDFTAWFGDDVLVRDHTTPLPQALLYALATEPQLKEMSLEET